MVVLAELGPAQAGSSRPDWCRYRHARTRPNGRSAPARHRERGSSPALPSERRLRPATVSCAICGPGFGQPAGGSLPSSWPRMASGGGKPLRLAKLTGLELGRHLHRRGGGAWWLEIPSVEVKVRIPIALHSPEPLVSALEAYLAHWWPRLAPPRSASAALPAAHGAGQRHGASHAHLRIPPRERRFGHQMFSIASLCRHMIAYVYS